MKTVLNVYILNMFKIDLEISHHKSLLYIFIVIELPLRVIGKIDINETLIDEAVSNCDEIPLNETSALLIESKNLFVDI